jgi:hypothetical protein
MSELSGEEIASLSGLSSIVATVDKLITDGVDAAEVAEKVLAFVSPTDAAAIGSLISVLQEVETLLGKV